MTAMPLIGLQSVVNSKHKNLEEKDTSDKKTNKRLLPVVSLVEDTVFEELVMLDRPCLLYWALYWGAADPRTQPSVREHAEMPHAVSVALWWTS